MMANGYDAGSMYDVGAPQATAGLIDSGDAGMQVLQRELLRRQQFAQQQMEMQRQAALDAQAVEFHKATLANTQEDTASKILQRKALEENERQRTTDLQSKAWDAAHGAGENITDPNVLKQGLALGKIRVQPGTPAKDAVPTQVGAVDPDSQLQMPDTPGTPAVAATPDQNINTGSVAQQEQKKHEDTLAALKKGDNLGLTQEFADQLRQVAALEEGGLLPKGSLNSAAVKLIQGGGGGGKPTKEEREREIAAVGVKRAMPGYSRAKDPDAAKDDATLAGERLVNQLAGEQARQRLDVNIGAGVNKREDEQTSRAIGAAYARGMKDYDSLTGVLNRAGNLAESLAAGGGVADATAAPDFLYIMAGGFGSGVRMTDTELNRINFSRSKLSDVLIWAKGLASDRPPKLDDTQRADMNKLAAYIATRELKRAEILHAGLSAINNAKSEKEVHELENDLKNAQIDIIGKASEHLDVKKPKTSNAAPTGETPAQRRTRLLGGG